MERGHCTNALRFWCLMIRAMPYLFHEVHNFCCCVVPAHVHIAFIPLPKVEDVAIPLVLHEGKFLDPIAAICHPGLAEVCHFLAELPDSVHFVRLGY